LQRCPDKLAAMKKRKTPKKTGGVITLNPLTCRDSPPQRAPS
jgi:hypothetical protein